ncbi:MAG: hypothetical protein HKN33_07110 [Pyrinomonadaceae bacterium]|nr:hypothetical protein [Pyrinomonadaceae bacterium]
MWNLTSTSAELRQELAKHNEWLLDDGNKSFSLNANEISISSIDGSLWLRFLSDEGLCEQIVEHAEVADGRFEFALKNEDSLIRLIPRVRAFELREGVESARLERVNGIAFDLTKQFRGFKPLRVELNEHGGRFAEIFAQKGRGFVAAISDVSGAVSHEAILAKAFNWQRKLGRRRTRSVKTVWIVASRKTARALNALCACLRGGEAGKIRILELNKTEPVQANTKFKELEMRRFSSLWSGRLPRLACLEHRRSSEFAASILADRPETIDRVFSANGETLRYRGLPFARTRSVRNAEQVWFGIEKNRIRLNEDTRPEFLDLLENLKTYRTHNAPNKQHEYFSASPEAWLESELRKNIRQLDPNLFLSPIYNQFRTAREKIDLLALRRDGRLVIVELKVAPDREMVFQAVDYWRKVESQRRRGNLERARLFENREIADKPTIIYLAAPTLGFHNEIEFFARKVKPQIEIVRFDLAENWRERISVIRRAILNPAQEL